MTVGSQEDTASCNIQTNLVSVVIEAQNVGKEKLIDLSDLTGDEEKSRINEQSEQITQGH